MIRLYNVGLAIACCMFAMCAVRGQSSQGRFSLGGQVTALGTIIVNQQNYGQNEMRYVLPVTLGAGIVADYAISPQLVLSSGFQYQRQGQAYRNSFKNRDFYREAYLNYWMIPLMVKYFPGAGGDAYTQNATAALPKLYFVGGLQPAILSTVFTIWEVDDNRTDFISFITEGGNPNQETIDELGSPESASELFTDIDLFVVGGIGAESRIQPTILLFADLRFGIGLTDLNAEAWRLPSVNGTYGPSLNGFFGLHAGIRVTLF